MIKHLAGAVLHVSPTVLMLVAIFLIAMLAVKCSNYNHTEQRSKLFDPVRFPFHAGLVGGTYGLVMIFRIIAISTIH